MHYKSQLIPIKASDIQWFYSKNEIVKACMLPDKVYILEHTLEQIMAELNPQFFFRANRQFIIQREAIKAIEPYFNGRLYVHVRVASPEPILVSKAKASSFKAWLDS